MKLSSCACNHCSYSCDFYSITVFGCNNAEPSSSRDDSKTFIDFKPFESDEIQETVGMRIYLRLYILHDNMDARPGTGNVSKKSLS
jgi:hypothetical protein